MSTAFDPLKFAQTLRDKAKLTSGQAERISEAFAVATSEEEEMVTKTNLDMRLKKMQLIIGGMIVGLGGVLIAVKFLGR